MLLQLRAPNPKFAFLLLAAAAAWIFHLYDGV